MALAAWALPRLGELLPLDQDSLKEIIAYNESLPKDAAAENLKTLLGDTAKALDFISSFNSRRFASLSSPTAPSSEVPVRPGKKNKGRRKEPLNKAFDVRKPENHGDIHGAYVKSQDDDYMPAVGRSKTGLRAASAFVLDSEEMEILAGPSEAKALPLAFNQPVEAKPSKRSQPLRTKIKKDTKISVQGGVPMHGQASTINDLDSAIRLLEIQTNPTLRDKQKDSRRRCDCMATRHALLTVAPNCLSCGKIICVKEGLGPCTFCRQPLLTGSEIQEMMKELVEQRGKEKMEANNASHKRAEVAKTPQPFSGASTPASSVVAFASPDVEGLAVAKQHRDKLLQFQAENARRTRIHDEASDFETPDAGLNMWASPQERALQLKRQQKILREQEWNARPEYEKRRQVVSIDIVGKKAIRRMANVECPEETDSEDGETIPASQDAEPTASFSKNPLLGNLIRPIYPGVNPSEHTREHRKHRLWRRVQDDIESNEKWILDGGALGDIQDRDAS